MGKVQECYGFLNEKEDVTPQPTRNLAGMSLGSLLHSTLYDKTKQI